MSRPTKRPRTPKRARPPSNLEDPEGPSGSESLPGDPPSRHFFYPLDEMRAECGGIGETTFRGKLARGLFPKPAMVDGRRPLWSVVEVEAWMLAGCPHEDVWRPEWTARCAATNMLPPKVKRTRKRKSGAS